MLKFALSMRILIKNGTILDPNSSHNGQQADILIEAGKIEAIQPNIQAEQANILDATDCHISIGWLDIGTQVGDPGLEHQEDISSVAKAAMAGGYTAIASFPNTQPAIHSKSEVFYLKNNAAQQLIDIFPIGAISQNCAGKDLAELYDMKEAGAVAFSDGKQSVLHSGLLMRALDYTKAFNGLVINHPHNPTLISNGQIHEGIVSTSMGLRGIPSISEELMLQRDIELLHYTQSKLHVLQVSTAKSVEMIRQAKANGLRITASVAAMNLTHTDEAVQDFNTQYKVLPPLRDEPARAALQAGVQDGTIDCITSNHRPLEPEAKKLEFTNASFGAIGLETTFALLHTQQILSLGQLVEKLAQYPRKVLNLEMPSIEKGNLANLTIFNTNLQWTYKATDIQSKSKNTPFIGQTFKGKVVAIVHKGQLQKV